MNNNLIDSVPGTRLMTSRDPLDVLVGKVKHQLSRKLGECIVPYQLPAIVTIENLAKWRAKNMEPVFLPELDLTENARLPKRWVRLGTAYYQWFREGKIGEIFPGVSPAKVRSGWYLADMSVGVDYTDGTRAFPNDPWVPLFTRLRAEKLIGGGYPETPAGSRFAVTYDEWIRVVLSFMASELGFPRADLRFERASEFNAIGNIYDPYRGKFNMWIWLADHFGDSRRLVGGHRSAGGLTHVRCLWPIGRDGPIAGRPLVVL